MELKERSCDACRANGKQPPASHTLYRQGDSAYHECERCALIYASPIPAAYTDSNDASFEALLDKYAGKIERNLKANRRTLRPLARYRQTNRFLEIGCNAGAILTAAESLGWQATGVDIAEAPVRFASEQRALDARLGAIETLAFDDDCFDVVFSNAVLEHLEHPSDTLTEAFRVLRPGGVMYADTVNWDSYTRRVLGEHWRYLEPLHHVHLYTPQNARTLAERFGFEVVRIWTTGVRLADRKHGQRFAAPWYVQLMKGPLSLATRFTDKGDSIKLLWRKPER